VKQRANSTLNPPTATGENVEKNNGRKGMEREEREEKWERRWRRMRGIWN
jgi:hypothetical protein